MRPLKLNGTSTKPIIFLCHSLGGIIVKRALSYAQTRTAQKVSNDRLIFTCTYAVLFFGTPHHGTSWANYLTRIEQLGAPAGMKKSDLLGALCLESETLQNITDYFVALLPHLRVYFFWSRSPRPWSSPAAPWCATLSCPRRATRRCMITRSARASRLITGG